MQNQQNNDLLLPSMYFIIGVFSGVAIHVDVSRGKIGGPTVAAIGHLGMRCRRGNPREIVPAAVGAIVGFSAAMIHQSFSQVDQMLENNTCPLEENTCLAETQFTF